MAITTNDKHRMIFNFNFLAIYLNKHLTFRIQDRNQIKWRPSSLSELTPMPFNMGLTHLGLDVSKCYFA